MKSLLWLRERQAQAYQTKLIKLPASCHDHLIKRLHCTQLFHDFIILLSHQYYIATAAQSLLCGTVYDVVCDSNDRAAIAVQQRWLQCNTEVLGDIPCLVPAVLGDALLRLSRVSPVLQHDTVASDHQLPLAAQWDDLARGGVHHLSLGKTDKGARQFNIWSNTCFSCFYPTHSSFKTQLKVLITVVFIFVVVENSRNKEKVLDSKRERYIQGQRPYWHYYNLHILQG